jgi:hexosaminidase
MVTARHRPPLHVKERVLISRMVHVKLAISLWSALGLGLGVAEAEPQNGNMTRSIVPKPAKLEAKEGVFALTVKTVLRASPGTEAETEKLAASLRIPTGLTCSVVSQDAQADVIVLELDRTMELDLGREGYRLSVASNRVLIRAASPAGLFYGGITFLQLMPPDVFSATRVSAPGRFGWEAPCVEIEDSPRFAWRGLLLDPARHFMTPGFIKKLMDVMALHKLNTLQLHLTDDQGWRLEIQKYPRLTEIGSIRQESPKRGDRDRGDGVPYGPHFYTQEQVRDLVSYAQARHITLVPEIEMPGHFLAALAAYPQFSCRGGPFAVRTRWGIEPDILCPGNDAAIAFVQDILGEVVDLFPSRFIHIGGDEAPRDRWKTCPKCQARIRAEGLKNEAHLQTRFNQRVEEFLTCRGRRLIGWDEILEGGLTSGAAVMSWRGTAGGSAAAEAGHDVVMSPTSHCYFDYAQAQGPQEPECIGGFIPLEKVYAFEPWPADLPESKRGHILGAQGNIWTEFIETPQEVEYFAFPRAVALAEVVWSPAALRGLDDFQSRLRGHLLRLNQYQVNYRRLDETP